jgi:hypothetical protein
MPDSLRPPTIEAVLGQYDLTAALRVQLLNALVQREDEVCDVLRAAGLQFGLYPEIVAEVFAEVGIGSPISAEQRDLVRNQFTALMDRLREEHERGHGTEQP